MSDWEMAVPRQELDGVVVCDIRAGNCRCAKEAGHVDAGDPVHGCHPDRCTGAWRGTWEDDDFIILSLPFPVGTPRPWEFQ